MTLYRFEAGIWDQTGSWLIINGNTTGPDYI